MIKEVLRKCISCSQIKDRNDMMKITKKYDTNELVINPDTKTFGRSVYICRNENCIKDAFKKNKIGKHLKTSVKNEFKEKIISTKGILSML